MPGRAILFQQLFRVRHSRPTATLSRCKCIRIPVKKISIGTLRSSLRCIHTGLISILPTQPVAQHVAERIQHHLPVIHVFTREGMPDAGADHAASYAAQQVELGLAVRRARIDMEDLLAQLGRNACRDHRTHRAGGHTGPTEVDVIADQSIGCVVGQVARHGARCSTGVVGRLQRASQRARLGRSPESRRKSASDCTSRHASPAEAGNTHGTTDGHTGGGACGTPDGCGCYHLPCCGGRGES